MSSYEYNPDTWSPILAGLVAGAAGAVAASLISFPLDSPDDNVFNTGTITVVALFIGGISGFLWRRLRASRNAKRSYWIAIGGALAAVLAALAITNLFATVNLFQYSIPVALLVLLSVGLLTPTLDRLAVPQWIGWVVVVAAVVVGTSGLFV